MKFEKAISFIINLNPRNKPSGKEDKVESIRVRLEKVIFKEYLNQFPEKEEMLREDLALRIEERLQIKLTDKSWSRVLNTLDGLFIKTYLEEIAPDHIKKLTPQEQTMNFIHHQTPHIREKTMKFMTESLGLDAESLEKILKLAPK